MGSGTTLIVSRRMGRNSIGIDIMTEYVEMVKEQLTIYQNSLFDKKVIYETTRFK